MPVVTAAALAVPGIAAAGSPITAALDTGLDNAQMGHVRVAGFDFVDNDADPNDTAENKHGSVGHSSSTTRRRRVGSCRFAPTPGTATAAAWCSPAAGPRSTSRWPIPTSRSSC
ncbi:MAG: hypothetical protein M5U09_10790 [Gammaproteobacteria bacterium]|nr:hypothetical protein [Gammaproteobacteria bacterium]